MGAHHEKARARPDLGPLGGSLWSPGSDRSLISLTFLRLSTQVRETLAQKKKEKKRERSARPYSRFKSCKTVGSMPGSKIWHEVARHCGLWSDPSFAGQGSIGLARAIPAERKLYATVRKGAGRSISPALTSRPYIRCTVREHQCHAGTVHIGANRGRASGDHGVSWISSRTKQ